MMKSFRASLTVIFLFLLILTPVLLWLPYSNFNSNRALFLSLGQISALIGYALYLINFILSSRFKVFDRLFMGINRMYISHHLYGVSAFILLILHPVFIALSYLTISLSSAFIFVLPTLRNLPQLYGTLALLITIILLVITLYVNLEYDRWKVTHKFLGIALFFSGMHILFIGSTLALSTSLRLYFYTLVLAALVSYARRTLLGRYFIKRYKFKITHLESVGEIFKIYLTAKDGLNFQYTPGQFIFVEFSRLGVAHQFHPFSITSSPNEREVGLGIKLLGEYTNSLKLLKIGDPALVEGPYGRFGFEYYPNPSQIWIAGGIGVTPFVGMAKSLPSNIKATLYYSVSDRSEAEYFRELTVVEKEKNNFNLVLWESKTKGRFSVREIEKDIKNTEFFICGPPPMMKALKEQLLNYKVPAGMIHTEEFSLS